MTVKVFISYAHESNLLSDMVLNFSNNLRREGIDSEIDQYEESPPEGWPKWMMRQIQNSDFVLVVCSKLFYERANDFSGTSTGSGVKWETNLILQQLYNLNTNNTKFIPVYFEESDNISIPLPLQPYTYYHLKDEQQKQKLINRLLGRSKSMRPDLGQESVHSLQEKERKSLFFSSIINIPLWDKAYWKGICYIGDPNFQKAPILGFYYESQIIGEKIFEELKSIFGNYDSKGEIRISIIENISKNKPYDYKVHFGSNHEIIAKKIEISGIDPYHAMMLMIGRIHEMNPKNDKNLSMFKMFYDRFKYFYITNVITSKSGQLTPNFKNLIRVDNINFREKKDIINNKNDPDYVVFS